MEYFDAYPSEYYHALKSNHNHYVLKIELLSYYENVIGEIEKELSISAQGQININYQQLTRRSCTLTLINLDNAYLPNPDGVVWINRKFKLWVGLRTSQDTFWFSQGVFVIQNATSDGHTVTIEAIDKGGILNGTIKLGMTETEYKIEAGSNIAQIIKDSLMLTFGGNDGGESSGCTPLDPIPPLIDFNYTNTQTQSEITLNSNDYIGDLFQQLAEGYGADVYYDTNGRLRFETLVDGERTDGYRYLPLIWSYGDITADYAQSNVEYQFDGINTVTVYTNASGIENVSYTAYNNNPLSPLRCDAVGIKRLENQEITYVNVSKSEMLQRCKDYARYLLFKQSFVGMNVSFNSIIIPHLDVNCAIGITDSLKGFENEKFIIQSITIPLSAGEMNVTATNVNWLPLDVDVEGGRGR